MEVYAGVPYPCGPTWPVPDVYETLVNALVRNGTGFNAVSAGEYSEGLKEERYVLEVYWVVLTTRFIPSARGLA